MIGEDVTIPFSETIPAMSFRESMPPPSQSSDCPQPQFDGGDGSPEEVAAFVAVMPFDLKKVEQRHRLDTLTFPLELAYLEAQDSLPERRKTGEA